MNSLWNNNTIEDEIQRNSLEYGMAVNADRSIPDAKSGLKPVAKRILYDAFLRGNVASKPHIKSAKLVGDTMGVFHPHGDSSIYGALIRLSQDWVLRYPLIDIHGNKGNIMGDGPASMRYTEARLTKLTEDGMLQGLKKKNVDFILNYDETEDEPVTLPAIFPNLLCNPNEGIGWAMGCAWAPHNLNEVAQAINDYLAGAEPSLPGPDFPTGGVVINSKDIPAIMKTGHGSVKIRGKYKIEKQNIVFYELPYGTRLEALMTEIGAACDEGKITNVEDIRNETNAKKGIRLVIEVTKGVNPEVVVNKLFAKTNLQTSFSYNQIALVNKTPTELNLKDCCKIYVDHNIDCIVREAKFDLKKATDRLHIVEGLLKALEDIDNIIALIKKSESAAAAKETLIKTYSFTEEQAKAILAMRLSNLANLEKIELEQEGAELNDNIQKLNALINSEDLQKSELQVRLAEIVKKYGDARRTELLNIEVAKEEKEIAEVVPEDVVVVTTQSGYMKKVPVASFKTQRRNTKGVKSNDELILDAVKTNTVDYMMIFSDAGNMYRTVVDNIPTATNAQKGTSIYDIVKMKQDETLMAVSSLHRKKMPKYVMFITKNGMIKKSYLEEYINTNRNTGVKALNLKDDDKLISVLFQDDEEILLITKCGYSIRFKTSDITPVGRAAAGVKAIKLNDGDSVVSAMSVHKPDDYVAIVTKSGMGKKVPLNEFTIQSRNGKGLQCSDEEVVGAEMVDDNDNLLLVGKPNTLCISVSELPILNRRALGNKTIKSGSVNSVTKY